MPDQDRPELPSEESPWAPFNLWWYRYRHRSGARRPTTPAPSPPKQRNRVAFVLVLSAGILLYTLLSAGRGTGVVTDAVGEQSALALVLVGLVAVGTGAAALLLTRDWLTALSLGVLALLLLLLQRILEPRWTPAIAWGVVAAGLLVFNLSWAATRWSRLALPPLVAATPLFALVVLALGFFLPIFWGLTR